MIRTYEKCKQNFGLETLKLEGLRVDNIKMELKGTSCVGRHWIELAQNWLISLAFVNTVLFKSI
jgi:hypothetical protein